MTDYHIVNKPVPPPSYLGDLTVYVSCMGFTTIISTTYVSTIQTKHIYIYIYTHIYICIYVYCVFETCSCLVVSI